MVIKIDYSYTLENQCFDCGTLISNTAFRCVTCANRENNSVKKIKNNCIDCSKVIYKGSERCRQCAGLQRVGAKHPRWIGGSLASGRGRGEYVLGYSTWKKSVFDRDGYTCQHCDSKVKIQAHHIESYYHHPELRIETENGITLCEICHKKLHYLFGKDVTTKQLIWFQENVK